MSGEQAVLTEARGDVLVITLHRPEAMNAIDRDVVTGLRAAFDRLDDDHTVRVGVLTGTGRGFCAGMDLKAFATHGIPDGMIEMLQTPPDKPLVAALEGFALAGGLELALLADLLVASRGTKLGIPEASVGLFAAGGGLLRLAQRLPLPLAYELALTAQPITAEVAHARGLVSRVTEPGEALAGALELAAAVCANAPAAVTTSKRLLRSVHQSQDRVFWEAQASEIVDVFSSEDATEGVASFIERRPAHWTGR